MAFPILPGFLTDYEYVDTGDFPQTSWEYWAVSVQMNSDAVTSNVRFIKGVSDTEVTTTPTNDTHFVDMAGGGAAFIGNERDVDMTPQNHVHALIYNFFIDHSYHAKGDAALHYGNTACNAACTNKCTSESTECLDPVEYYSCTWFDGGDADCWNCLDPMCMSCSSYWTHDSCNVGSCHEFATESANECTCIDAAQSRSNPRTDRCFGECQGECQTCSPQNESSYGDLIANCSACAASAKDISGSTDYSYCIDACPTQFTDGGSACTIDQELIISFNFLVPKTTFTSTGAATQGDDIAAPAPGDEFYAVSNGGYPAPYRGFYIADNTSYVSLLEVILNKDFAVHAWIKIETVPGAGELSTVFSKDKHDATTPVSTNFIRCAIDENLNLTIEMVRDGATNFTQKVLDKQIVQSTWNYVVYSFDFSADALSSPKTSYTEVTGYVDNSASTTELFDRYFINDKADYNAYIGSSRSGTTTWEHPLDGFIYEFHLYQVAFAGANDHYQGGQGCYDGYTSNSCWRADFGYYTTDGTNINQQSCDSPSCDSRGCLDDVSCVETNQCVDVPPFCHLCPDKLCTACDTYDACTAGFCQTNAHDDGNVCACDDGYVREAINTVNEICNPCFSDCKTCTASDGVTPDFSVCSECMPTSVNTVDASLAYDYCETACPTNMEAVDGYQCLLAAHQILYIEFNIVGINYENQATTNFFGGNDLTITATQDDPNSTTTVPNLYPAIYRGVYFRGDSTNPGYVNISNIKLSHTFSIHTWLMRKTESVQQAIFSKDKAYDLQVLAYIDASNKMSLDLNNSECVTTAGGNDLVVDTWYYLAWSVEESGGNSANIHAWVNNNNAINDSCTGNFVMFDLNTYESYVGIKLTGATAYADEFHGFMWEIRINQSAYTSASSSYFSVSPPCDVSAPCAIDGILHTTDDFAQYGNDNSVCGTNCAYTGCRRTGDCQLTADCEAVETNTGEKYCNLCFDRECATCSTYDDECTVCNISGNAALDGTHCICNDGYGRPVDKQALCKECWTHCKACDVSELEHYNDCTACDDDRFDTTPSPNDVSGYRFCSGECPTLWTCDTGVTPYGVTAPSTAAEFELYAYYFAQAFPDSLNQWANDVAGEESRLATLNVAAPDGLVASFRGIYFNGQNAWVDLESTLVLNHSFSVYVWTYHQSVTGQQVIFVKDRNPDLFLRFYIHIDTVKVDLAKDNDHTDSDTIDSGATITDRSWSFLGFSAQLLLHKDTEIKVYQNALLSHTGTISEKFVDDQAAWPASIGIERSATDTEDQNPFIGFIYEFHLWQSTVDGTALH